MRSSADTHEKETIGDDFWGGNLTWNITDEHSLSYTAFTDERAIVVKQYDYDLDNKTTGELSVNAPVGKELTSINISSDGSKFIGEKPGILDGAFDNFDSAK